MCITSGLYAQKKIVLHDLMPKAYTVQEVPSLSGKSYNVTDQSTLEIKRYDVNNTFGVYNVTETTLYRRKEDKKSSYNDINWTSKTNRDDWLDYKNYKYKNQEEEEENDN